MQPETTRVGRGATGVRGASRAMAVAWSFVLTGLALASAGCAGRGGVVDDFRRGPGKGWEVLREDRSAWRATEDGLAVRVLPGNMWGGSNDARNTFVRAVPDPSTGPVEVSVEVENRPTEQYEQVDLVWYYGDGHQVKIGQERVDGKLCIVMGREENDRTRTIAILPLDSFVVELRHRVDGQRITGAYRTPGSKEWTVAGTCEVAVKPGEPGPRVSLQAYQGPAAVERWARLRRFTVRRGPFAD